MNGQRPLRRHRFSAGLIWYATFLALLVLAPAHGWAELCTGCVETALTAVPPGSPYPQYLADLPVWEPDGDRILYTRKDNISNTYKKNVYEVNSSNPLVERLRVQAPPYGQDFPAALAWGPGGTALIAEGHVGLYNEYLSFTVPTGTSSLNRTSTDGNGQGLTVKLKGNYVSSGPIGGMDQESLDMISVSRDGSTVLVRWSSLMSPAPNYQRTTRIFTAPFDSMTGQFVSQAGVDTDWEDQPGVRKHIETSANYLSRPWSGGASFTPDGSQFLISDGNSIYLYNTNGDLFYDQVPAGRPYRAILTGAFDPLQGFYVIKYNQPAVSPDGKHFVAFKSIFEGTYGLFMYDMNGGNERALVSGPGVYVNWPTFSPDGMSIAYARAGRIFRLSAVQGTGDCNTNGLPDMCDVPGWNSPLPGPICSYACFPAIGPPANCGASEDCDSNGIPDTCQLEEDDSDHNGLIDACEGPSVQFDLAASSGPESTTSAAIGVSLSEALLDTVTVKYATASGTAAAGSDYTSKSGTLTFAPGQISKTITVPIINDTGLEPDETFTVVLSEPTESLRIGAIASHAYTIVNDDNGGVLKLGAATYSVSEAGPAAKITVLRTGTNIGDIGVRFATANVTATAGSDYSAVDVPIEWPSGNMMATTVLVPITKDFFDEPNETFTVALSAPTGGAELGSPNFATVTITDDDPTPTVQFAAAASSAVEASGVAAFDVVLSAPTILPVTVDFATSDGTAKSAGEEDYRAFNGTLTFEPGEGTVRTLLVKVTADSAVEPNETFSMALSKPTGGAALGARPKHTFTILNDDPSGMVQLSAAAYAVSESGPVAMITVSRSGGGSGTVSVNYATADGTAKAGSDYTQVKGTLTWPDGNTEEQTIEVPIAGDSMDELAETFTIKLSAPTGGAILGPKSGATVTIEDDDLPPEVRFDSADSAGAESTTPAAIVVSLSEKSSLPVKVNYTTVGGTAVPVGDYTTTRGTLTFMPGQTSKTISVAIKNDTLPEDAEPEDSDPDPESFTVSLSSPVNATLVEPSVHTYLIFDEDVAGAIKLSAAAYTVNEAGAVTITATRVGGRSGEVSVSFTIEDVTATAGSDYTAPPFPWTLTWGDKVLGSKTFTVPITPDAFDEPNETFTVKLSKPEGGAVLGSPSAATVKITDNDPTPMVKFSSAASSWPEDYSGPIPIDVVLSAASNREVRVKYATAKATAGYDDFEAASGELVFIPGETSTSIEVHAHGEGLVESDEAFTVTLSSPVNALLGTPSKHTRTILNDDPSGVITWLPGEYSVSEDGSGYTVKLYRIGGLSGEVAMSYATADGTAKEGSDYTSTSGTVSWAEGETGERSFTVPTLDDALDEPNETFTIKMSAPTGGATYQGPSSATVTILDDDPLPEVHFGAAASGGTESTTPAVIEVVLSAASSRTVTVKYATAKGTAVPVTDFTTKTGTLTFTPGQTSTTISVPIVNNAIHEDPEFFTVSLTSPINATVVEPSVHGYTVEDDDAGGLAADAGPTIVR